MPEAIIATIKRFISRAILAGLVGAAIAFAYLLFLPKQYSITANLAVFPASSATDKNLSLETGNTAEIINSAAFMKNTFPGEEKNFLGAIRVQDSSLVKLNFLATLDERNAVEDAATSVPQAVSDYARDLYEGSPFKYKLLGDPEMSAGPVEPNLSKYLGSGFVLGAIVFFLYWLFFEFLWIPKPKEAITSSASSARKEIPIPTVNFHRDSFEKHFDEIEKKFGTPEQEPEPPISEPEPKVIRPISAPVEHLVPENLPIADMEISSEPEIIEEHSPLPSAEYQEPTDEEVKDRLNKLMRGEL